MEADQFRGGDGGSAEVEGAAGRYPVDQVLRGGQVGGEVEEVEVPDIAAAVRLLIPAIRAESFGEAVHQEIGLRIERDRARHHGPFGERQTSDLDLGRSGVSGCGVEGTAVALDDRLRQVDLLAVGLQCADCEVSRAGFACMPMTGSSHRAGLDGELVEAKAEVAVRWRAEYDGDGPAAAFGGW